MHSTEASQGVTHFPSWEGSPARPEEPPLPQPCVRDANPSPGEEALYFASATLLQGAGSESAQKEHVCVCAETYLSVFGPRAHNVLEEDQSHPQGEEEEAKAPWGL